MTLDRDLQSIQEARELVRRAKAAQAAFASFTQEQVDRVVRAIAEAGAAHAEALAKLAQEETGFGKWQDKTVKNILASTMVYESVKDVRTIGVLSEDRARGLMEVAVPMGVVAALIPSTNPTSTTIFKAIIALKAGNAIVMSPHPNAKNCILETVKIIARAAEDAGAPKDIIQAVTLITPQAVDALMRDRDTGVILATGGEAMVRAAYSSGNPAIGVGPGNGPAFIERSADIPTAVRHIVESKTFDNGTICASEQSIVTEKCIEENVVTELERQHCFFLSEEQSKKVSALLLRANGTINPAVVGKCAQTIARLAGIEVPQDALVLVSRQTEVSKKNPFSREKLCPVLAFYVESGWESACERCIAILKNEGAGHTMTIHSQNEAVIREFALKKPTSRLLVNTAAALGGVGATTNLLPALTLGCGAVGGSATSDNVGPLNLINIRRVAWGVRELSELRGGAGTQSAGGAKAAGALTAADIEAITRAVIEKLSARA